MKLRLLAFGKLKNRAYRRLSEDYLERIKKFFPMSMEEIAEEPYSPKVGVKALAKEEERLLKRLKSHTYLILLDEKGQSMGSAAWAKKLEGFFNAGYSELAWAIGSAYGVSENLKKRAKETWSLSKLTFPHEMARVVFLEQLYRALSINKGLPYHHE